MIPDKEETFMNSNYSNRNHTTETANSPTVPFTEECMGKLLTAYKSLRDLENLLSLIAGIDPSNGLLSNLQHMDYLIQNLSPLYDRNLDYDDDSWDIRTAFLNYPDKVLVTPGQDS